MRRLRLQGLALLLFAGGAVSAAGVQPVVAAAGCTAGPHHATVVVEHASGATLSSCVGFSGSTISGEQLLRASGIESQVQSFGGGLGDAVCQVDYEPAQYSSNCFGTSMYWSVFSSRQCGPWSSAQVGVDSLTLGDGDLEGLRYEAQPRSVPPPGPNGFCPPRATAATPPPPTARTTASAARSPSAVAVTTAAPAVVHAVSPPPLAVSGATADPSAVPSESATRSAGVPLSGAPRPGPSASTPQPSGSPLSWILFAALSVILLVAALVQIRAHGRASRASVG